jgi:hypothetical protein
VGEFGTPGGGGDGWFGERGAHDWRRPLPQPPPAMGGGVKASTALPPPLAGGGWGEGSHRPIIPNT